MERQVGIGYSGSQGQIRAGLKKDGQLVGRVEAELQVIWMMAFTLQ